MNTLVCVDDFEKEASRLLSSSIRSYFSCAADDEWSMRENVDAFSRIHIRPRVLQDVSKRNLSTSVLGKRVKVPLGIAPTALQKLAHPDGECAAARAVEKVGGIMVLSIFGTSSYEDVAASAPGARKWCQIFLHLDRSRTEALLERAEKAGFEAAVLTVDHPVLGKRRANLRNPFEFPTHLKLPNIMPDGEDVVMSKVHDIFDHSLTWETVSWLKRVSKMPLVLKGIQTPSDALKAIEHGVSAVWVSNHGGRQLDTVPSTIDILPSIVTAVAGRAEVYVDGGIRRGTDIFKALALGARMVFVGRPPIWGLTVAGAQGATKVLEILRDELDLALALSGVNDVRNLTAENVGQRERISRL